MINNYSKVVTQLKYTPEGRIALSEKRAQQWVVPAIVLSAVIWWVIFRNLAPIPISGWPSIGAGALISSMLITLICFPLSYMEGINYAKHYNPALDFRGLRKLFSVVTLSLAFTIVVAILIGVGTFVFNLAFKDLTLDQYSSAAIIGLVTGITAYSIISTATKLVTRDIVNAFTAFMLVGVFASMITSQNPYWWEQNFSSLGTSSSFSSLAFNYTLILSGFLMICMSQHLFADLQAITGHRRGQINANVIRALFVFIAICLAGVGLFPYSQHPALHNLSAYSMVLGFATLIIGLRWLIPTIGNAFLNLSYTILATIGAAYFLFTYLHYFNLTAFELTAFSITFVWLVLFLRTVGVMQATTATTQK
jgi:hypothetical membrane protein